LTTSAFLATPQLLERESEPAQQRAALIVSGRRGHERHVHATLTVHLVGVDLMEHELLVQPEGVVPTAVELPVGQATEVTDPGRASDSRRSQNSHIRSPRSVTCAPMGMPSRELELAIDFRARAIAASAR